MAEAPKPLTSNLPELTTLANSGVLFGILLIGLAIWLFTSGNKLLKEEHNENKSVC